MVFILIILEYVQIHDYILTNNKSNQTFFSQTMRNIPARIIIVN